MGKARYFTVGLKEKVRNRLVSRAIDPRVEARDIEQAALAEALAEALYNSRHDINERREMNRLPDGWLPIASAVTVSIPFESNQQLKLEHPVRHPARGGMSFNLLDLPGDLRERVETYVKEAKAIEADRSKLKREVDATLEGFRTVEKAIAGWPEAASLISEVVGDPKPVNLPAVTSLNAALGLPPEENKQ